MAGRTPAWSVSAVRTSPRRKLLAILVAVLVAGSLAELGALGTWTTETSLPTATQEVSVATLNNQVFVAAGSVNQVRTNAAWLFDPTSHAWTSLAPYPGIAR